MPWTRVGIEVATDPERARETIARAYAENRTGVAAAKHLGVTDRQLRRWTVALGLRPRLRRRDELYPPDDLFDLDE